MGNTKKIFILIRNGLAFVYSWLVLCVVVLSFAGGQESIKTSFLLKLLGLSAWGVICFAICFGNQRFQRKGFIFQLTLCYVLFIPIEILMFYLMGIFQRGGSGAALWIIFFSIIGVLYITSLVIDKIVMKKKAEDYTQKLREYNRVG